MPRIEIPTLVRSTDGTVSFAFPGLQEIHTIPVVEHPLVQQPLLLRDTNGNVTLYIPTGEKGQEVLFQLKTQAVAWTFKQAMEED